MMVVSRNVITDTKIKSIEVRVLERGHKIITYTGVKLVTVNNTGILEIELLDGDIIIRNVNRNLLFEIKLFKGEK